MGSTATSLISIFSTSILLSSSKPSFSSQISIVLKFILLLSSPASRLFRIISFFPRRPLIIWRKKRLVGQKTCWLLIPAVHNTPTGDVTHPWHLDQRRGFFAMMSYRKVDLLLQNWPKNNPSYCCCHQYLPRGLIQNKIQTRHEKMKNQSASTNITATTEAIKPPISEAKEK